MAPGLCKLPNLLNLSFLINEVGYKLLDKFMLRKGGIVYDVSGMVAGGN